MKLTVVQPLLALVEAVQITWASGGIEQATAFHLLPDGNSNHAVVVSVCACRPAKWTARTNNHRNRHVHVHAPIHNSPQPASQLPHVCTHPRTSKTRAANSPHINRRLHSTSTHNLSKPAQLRRPWTQSRRSSQRSTSSRSACKASRSSSAGRIVWQAEPPSCAVA